MTPRRALNILVLLWAAMPFSVGEILTRASAEQSHGFKLVVALLAWSLWAGGLLSACVPHPISLTVQRLATPMSLATVALCSAASTSGSISPWWFGLAAAHATALVSVGLGAYMADACVGATAYGDEVRFTMRVPFSFAVGPMPVTWLVSATSNIAALVLVRHQRIALACICAVFSIAAWTVTARSYHAMSRRWVVFVPAGLTFVDHLVAAEPFLVRRQDLSIAPASATPEALDLALSPLGTPLDVACATPIEFTRRLSRDSAEVDQTQSIRFSVVRPQALLSIALQRGFDVEPAALN